MNPQLENGYLRLARELVEQFATLHLSGGEWQILWVVFRKTYGWNKKEDKISLTQFSKDTGLSRPTICDALNSLVKKNILLVSKSLLSTNVYSFNKTYSNWVVRKSLPSKVFGKKVVRKMVPEVVRKMVPTINNNKNNIQKTIKATDVADTLNHLIGLFKNVNPNYNLLFGNKTQRSALQRQVDKFTYKRIENLLNQLPEIVARPYAPRITTPVQLENSMGKLIIFLKQDNLDRKEVVDARGI